MVLHSKPRVTERLLALDQHIREESKPRRTCLVTDDAASTKNIPFFSNHNPHEIMILEIFRGLQLQFSGVFDLICITVSLFL